MFILEVALTPSQFRVIKSQNLKDRNRPKKFTSFTYFILLNGTNRQFILQREPKYQSRRESRIPVQKYA